MRLSQLIRAPEFLRLTRCALRAAGMGAAAEWQDILKEAFKGMVILAILERLHLTRPVNWLEEHGA